MSKNKARLKRVVTLTTALMAANLPADEIAEIRQSLDKHLPHDLNYEIAQSPVKGIYKVIIGPQVLFFYRSDESSYLIEGNIFDLQTRENITEELKQEARAKTISDIPEKDMLLFPAPGATHKTVTIFVDVDCGFCRQLHGEIDAYHKKGISIRYLFYPRDGKNSESYQRAKNVWCSANKEEAMTAIMKGKTLPNAECDAPIDKHIAIGKLIGVRGTPAIILPSGEHITGYLSAENLSAKMSDTQ